MFSLIVLEDTVRIPPEKFDKALEIVTHEELSGKFEGIVSNELGFVVAVTNMEVSPVGRVIPGDGATYHSVSFTLLSYSPEVQEIVEGEVVEVEDFGAFIRVGPIDALLHVSQVIDDFVSYDERRGTLMAKNTGRLLQQGDTIRGRITVVSLGRGGSSGKIGMTMRQPFLGKIEWIAEDAEVARKQLEERRKEALAKTA
ncbi:DNA-directed RNA polymerase [Candidatus Bathyarchaeota archaeon]|nr:MAG: DNA-directed RNA polymerase [Candidatus Bathyarchaeota archaeon]